MRRHFITMSLTISSATRSAVLRTRELSIGLIPTDTAGRASSIVIGNTPVRDSTKLGRINKIIMMIMADRDELRKSAISRGVSAPAQRHSMSCVRRAGIVRR